MQVTAVPAVQVPVWQLSSPLHALPSLHDVPFPTLFVWHTPDPLHVSGLSHAELDEFPQAVPADAALPLVQVPDWQESLTVQAFPSLHALPLVRVA